MGLGFYLDEGWCFICKEECYDMMKSPAVRTKVKLIAITSFGL